MRKITSLTAFLSFFMMLLTSVVLYLTPQGRVAYWADWRLLGLSKEQWGAIHILIVLESPSRFRQFTSGSEVEWEQNSRSTPIHPSC